MSFKFTLSASSAAVAMHTGSTSTRCLRSSVSSLRFCVLFSQLTVVNQCVVLQSPSVLAKPTPTTVLLVSSSSVVLMSHVPIPFPVYIVSSTLRQGCARTSIFASPRALHARLDRSAGLRYITLSAPWTSRSKAVNIGTQLFGFGRDHNIRGVSGGHKVTFRTASIGPAMAQCRYGGELRTVSGRRTLRPDLDPRFSAPLWSSGAT
ncbi:hypothetical protein GY45DRAFT_1135653 [Cubamyces sp. BRFM 1775]|nr:hypothetical protein GY45DRAFT_1135653 [Cubamyces sp. BRFM 1775]